MSEELKTLQAVVQRSSRAAFVARYPGLFLLVEMPGNEALGFKTRIASSPTLRSIVPATQSKQASDAPAERMVLPLRKSDRNTWRSRISMGRATNNDLVIRHESVSKLHAHFQVVRQDGAEHLVISDAGSVNGTLVNGRSVGEPPDGGVTVQAGDRILLGDVQCELLDAGRLYDRLSRLEASDF